jgi:hypothetical protein
MEHGQSTVFMLMGTCGQKAHAYIAIKKHFIFLLINGFQCKENKAVYPKRHNKNSPHPSSTDTGYSLGFGSTSGSYLIFTGNPKRKTPQPSSFLPYFTRLSES